MIRVDGVAEMQKKVRLLCVDDVEQCKWAVAFFHVRAESKAEGGSSRGRGPEAVHCGNRLIRFRIHNSVKPCFTGFKLSETYRGAVVSVACQGSDWPLCQLAFARTIINAYTRLGPGSHPD